MLMLHIPGPYAPTKDMDVLLRPLIDELSQLWDEGVVIKDAASGNNFKLHATLLCIVNDFPARSSLSRWSGHGYKACPTSNDDTPSVRCQSKNVYVGHRRWLGTSHLFRKNLRFNGKHEKAKPPRTLTTTDILR